MVIKRIGMIGFVLAFICAVVVFSGYGSQLLSRQHAKIGMIIFGAIGLFMNLLSFKYQQENENYNILFWIGSIVIFFGLILRIERLPFSQYVIIAGTLLSGISFFFNPFSTSNRKSKDDLLDN
jgi:heme/copper-type cytochrome/quinol oxidase subunit 4